MPQKTNTTYLLGTEHIDKYPTIAPETPLEEK